MRHTQRAPRSCKECSSRKIKCDKGIPCKPCTKRGQAARCTREVVLVRGVITVARSEGPQAHIPALPPDQKYVSSSSSRNHERQLAPAELSTDDMINHPQKLMSLVFPSQFISVVQTWDDIYMPSRSQSLKLIQHGKVWTSWIHCAVNYARFGNEHEEFWEFLESGGRLWERNPSWLAIYFALLTAAILTSDEDNMDPSILPHGNLNSLLHTWYSASLYCLEVAKYTRCSDFMHVQAIGILQMCCNAVGDIVFRNRLMAIGIQIANDLEMPYKAGPEHSIIDAEVSKRLWWVFVIGEWLNPATHRPSLSEEDFDVEFPLPVDDDELERGLTSFKPSPKVISPWWYHIILCKTALVHHRFTQGIRKTTTDLEVLVRIADEGLADIIESLPAHLQPREENMPQSTDVDDRYPWIRWQRVDLIMMLLLLRSKINYECRNFWSNSPPTSLPRRSLCLRSAQSVIMLSEGEDMPIYQRRYMTYTLRLYGAGLIIASEIPRSTNTNESSGLINSLLTCIQLLEQSKDLNIVAEKAVEHLRSFLLRINNEIICPSS
ncbi:hypothetical protein BKA64DRAFT_108482 [Cadophora sp. MPI-SDFR-AT-0126]|nr:hypothetical protein BKA64DRAFT_108482 [Leotiomycetes sp. MPI-SDFR-AT-0126]